MGFGIDTITNKAGIIHIGIIPALCVGITMFSINYVAINTANSISISKRKLFIAQQKMRCYIGGYMTCQIASVPANLCDIIENNGYFIKGRIVELATHNICF
ncbi:hypothetical protein FIU87_10755 [Bacillus sp. THAF10]|nr:hypothetical protein FIU87_10755 [Bacillus sp. THAF10]